MQASATSRRLYAVRRHSGIGGIAGTLKIPLHPGGASNESGAGNGEGPDALTDRLSWELSHERPMLERAELSSLAVRRLSAAARVGPPTSISPSVSQRRSSFSTSPEMRRALPSTALSVVETTSFGVCCQSFENSCSMGERLGSSVPQ